MVRKIIHIDEERCTGCGLCADACHEGAIDIVDGKAKLVRENFCDGFGDCLPGCPEGAITFEEREAPEYDQEAVQRRKQELAESQPAGQGSGRNSGRDDHMEREEQHMHHEGGCPGSRTMQFHRENREGGYAGESAGGPSPAFRKPVSRLMQWPVQIKLLPTKAPFYDGAKLLIAADCTAYAYANMHEEFMKGRVTMIGCPKLDGVDYYDKFLEIFRNNDIQSLTIVRMDVPCCGGIQMAAQDALKASGKFIPWQVVTVRRDGQIMD